MEKIPSFTVNHEQLQRGVYVVRTQQGTQKITVE